MNSVNKILQRPFSCRYFEGTIEIKTVGQLILKLNLCQAFQRVNGQGNFHDRFIPKRRDFNAEYSRYLMTKTEEVPIDILAQECNYYSLKEYELQLKSCLFGKTQERILPLYEANKKFGTYSQPHHWEVKPRHKPIIETSPIALDLPNFSTDFCFNLMDWSSKNDIMAALKNSLYLFNVDSKQILSITEINQNITCVKWNCQGTDLLIAHKSGLLVWTEKSLKTLDLTVDCHPMCYVTSIDFNPRSNYVVTGCSSGKVTLYQYPISTKPSSSKLLNYRIATVAFSVNGRFIACSGIHHIVNILWFPDCTTAYKIFMSAPVRALAWHPHQLSYICVGDINGFISLHNILLQEARAEYIPQYESSVYCLTFNPISYELVTSHWIHGTEPNVKAHTQLNVLESFDRIVDRLHGQQSGRVLYLKWSPDGKQIASAGSNEILQIWNFMPDHASAEYKKKTTHKSDCKSIYSTNRKPDEIMNFAFRFDCIR